MNIFTNCYILIFCHKLDCNWSYVRNLFAFGFSSKITTDHFGYSHLQQLVVCFH